MNPFFLFFGLILSAAYADTPKIVFTLEKGKPIEATLGEGKVAHFALAKKDPIIFPVPYQVTENTCNSHIGMRCEFHGGFAADFMALVWKTHPDPKKIGMGVKYRLKGMTTPYADLFDLNIYGAESKIKTPIIAAKLPVEKIVCQDYSWAPVGKTEAPDTVNISRWDVEAMQINPETGLTENRTIGVALKVNLKKNAQGTLDIKEVKKYTGSPANSFFGDIWSFVMPTGTGEYCFISMKPNLVGFDTKFIEYLSSPPKFVPYLYQSDEYTTPPEKFHFNSFIKTVDTYEFE